MTAGLLEILNVGFGDMKLTFNKHDESETAKARRAVEKMLKDGYAILIENPDHTYSRVQAFDPATDCYIVGDVEEPVTAAVAYTETEPPQKKRGRTKKVPARTARAVAVARSAGG